MAASSISTQNERIGGPNTASKAPQKEKVYSDPMRYASISGLPIETVKDPEKWVLVRTRHLGVLLPSCSCFLLLFAEAVAYKDLDCWCKIGTTSMLIASKTRPTQVASASGGKKKNILHQFTRFTGRWYTDEAVLDTEGGKEGVEEKGE
jgi:hypothetical protein